MTQPDKRIHRRDTADEETADRTLRKMFRQRLSLRMRQLELSQSKLAERLGMKQNTLSDWFNPRISSLPGGMAMVKLPDILRCSGHWLLTGQGPIEPPHLSKKEQHMRSEGALEVIADVRRTIEEAEKHFIGNGRAKR